MPNTERVFKAEDVTAMLAEMLNSQSGVSKPKHEFSPLAVYLLQKAEMLDDVLVDSPHKIAKTTVEEITLDFTRTKVLGERKAEIRIKQIMDNSEYLKRFKYRSVKELSVPVQSRAITRKNLTSREQYGTSGLTINTRITRNFGINLELKNLELNWHLPLRTVVDNLWNPNFDREMAQDVATALSNDILLLICNGLETTTFASDPDFYNLMKGFVQILREADGQNTNTYGSITIQGFLGKYLTPIKIDTSTVVASYTASNLMALMESMYDAMPAIYRNDPDTVFIMSEKDYQLYAKGRRGNSLESGDKRTTDGGAPNFLGRRILTFPDLYAINEVHEAYATKYGAIILGRLSDIDVASTPQRYRHSIKFDEECDDGATFKHFYHMYMDVQIARRDAFVIAYNGAKLSTPYLILPADYPKGTSDKVALTAGNVDFATATYTVHPVVDNGEARIYYGTTDISALTEAQCIADGSTSLLVEGESITVTGATVGEDNSVYIRAFSDNAVASDTITITYNAS